MSEITDEELYVLVFQRPLIRTKRGMPIMPPGYVMGWVRRAYNLGAKRGWDEGKDAERKFQHRPLGKWYFEANPYNESEPADASV